MLKPRARGFSLIEMMTVVMIIAILTVIALPSFSEWVQNSRTRSVAESLQNGIRFAQAQSASLSRLTQVVTTSTGWTVSFVKITGVDDAVAGTVLQSSPAGNLDSVAIGYGTGAPVVLQFNDLGRVWGSATSGGIFSPLWARSHTTSRTRIPVARAA